MELSREFLAGLVVDLLDADKVDNVSPFKDCWLTIGALKAVICKRYNVESEDVAMGELSKAMEEYKTGKFKIISTQKNKPVHCHKQSTWKQYTTNDGFLSTKKKRWLVFLSRSKKAPALPGNKENQLWQDLLLKCHEIEFRSNLDTGVGSIENESEICLAKQKVCC
ncbi:expressed unknown protein [Seminavis robusta]|uniref:Uncharacterized protein n=1 Tax=Seminavis robusta TaxID=568900 RepID=A0A9N8EEQ2_9STRA|nr:expressed unknown protein [Seminavis robusta]|eukprot:Sro968_g226021.1  (166) ;mRNA; r:22753-23250